MPLNVMLMLIAAVIVAVGAEAADVGGCSQTSTSTLLQPQSQRGKRCNSSGGRGCEVGKCKARWRVEEHHGKSRHSAGPNQLRCRMDHDFQCALVVPLQPTLQSIQQQSGALYLKDQPPVKIRHKQNVELSLMDLDDFESCTGQSGMSANMVIMAQANY